VDVLIDRRELLEKARERKLSLGMVEKDYVLGWLLFGFSKTNLIFKGGTGLSKIFFPKVWRLSEDLDFSFGGEFEKIEIEKILKVVEEKSGIVLKLKSRYENPEYLQLKIQYKALLGKNWIKVDVTREKVLEKPLIKSISKDYSDYPDFKIKVMCLEEIIAEKIRALIERKKSRDYYDIWKTLSLKINRKLIAKLLSRKCKIKGVKLNMEEIFPENLKEILEPYWKRELSRLVYPVPDLNRVIRELKFRLNFLSN